VNTEEFERAQREREYFHRLTVLPGAWTVLRLDGRGFSATTETLLNQLGARYGYTESDEISLLLRPGFDLFGRSVEKLVSVSAGIASATFTHAAGVPAHFDSRLWLGTTIADVADYFSWRQSDAARCALNGWSYWTLRKAGQSRQQATRALEGMSTSAKNELLSYRRLIEEIASETPGG